ncbi:MAG: MFS transporter [Planctomycetes bacterium]|nr:MFS transporter [Planctomycetota bacterium]
MKRLRLSSWILYDFANTIFSMNIVTLYFSLWVTVNNGKPDLWVGIANGASAFLILVTLPLLGVWSDAYHRKQMYLSLSTVACCAFTALMGVAAMSGLGPTGRVLSALVAFVIANFGYHAGLVFYNALLMSVTEQKVMGRVSGYGVAAGYLGAIIGLFLVVPFAEGAVLGKGFPGLSGKWERVAELKAGSNGYVPAPGASGRSIYRDGPLDLDANYEYEVRKDGWTARDVKARDLYQDGHRPKNKDDAGDGTQDFSLKGRFFEVSWEGAAEGAALWRRTRGWGRAGTFIPTGILFLAFALPCMIWVRERPAPNHAAPGLKAAYMKVWQSLRHTQKHPGVLRFLIGKYFYEDSIATVYIFMAVYASKVLKFADGEQRVFLMTATTFAMVGSFGAGFVTDRIGPKKTIMIVLAGWVVFLTAAVATTERNHFWVIGPALGVLLGSMWTSSRPLLVTLVPRESQGEFFALSELTGKMSAVMGPALWGLIILWADKAGASLINQYRWAIASLVLMIIIGGAIIWKVPDHHRKQAA